MGITDAIIWDEGPAIMLYDWNNTSCLGNIVPTELSDALISTANEKEIPYQIGVTLNCGTDAALISYLVQE